MTWSVSGLQILLAYSPRRLCLKYSLGGLNRSKSHHFRMQPPNELREPYPITQSVGLRPSSTTLPGTRTSTTITQMFVSSPRTRGRGRLKRSGSGTHFGPTQSKRAAERQTRMNSRTSDKGTVVLYLHSFHSTSGQLKYTFLDCLTQVHTHGWLFQCSRPRPHRITLILRGRAQHPHVNTRRLYFVGYPSLPQFQTSRPHRTVGLPSTPIVSYAPWWRDETC